MQNVYKRKDSNQRTLLYTYDSAHYDGESEYSHADE